MLLKLVGVSPSCYTSPLTSGTEGVVGGFSLVNSIS
jgi:hypothetical protein